MRLWFVLYDRFLGVLCTRFEVALSVMWTIGSSHLDMEIQNLIQKWIKSIMLCAQVHVVTSSCHLMCNAHRDTAQPDVETHHFGVNSIFGGELV